MLECDGCGNKASIAIRAGFFKNERGEREYYQTCDRCGDVNFGCGLVDVYWDGTEEHGLPDNPKTGKPYVFSSKKEKARFLKENHLRESGDRIHGSMIHSTRENVSCETNDDSVKEAIAHVRQMGHDVRRQEFMRIIKNAPK
jgi:hypothetical protein